MPVWSLYIHLLSWVPLTWTCVRVRALASHSRETCKCCGCGHTEWPTSAVAFLEPSLGEYTHFWEEWFGNGESEGSFSDSCPTRGRKSVSCTVRQEPGCQLHFPRRSPSAAHSRLSKCASVSLLQVPKVRGKMEDESDMKHTSMLPTNPVPKSVVPLSSTNVAI